MRSLHVNAGNLFGGIEVLLATLARHRELCPELEMELAVCFPGRVRAEVSATGTPVHVLGAARVSRPWTLWRVRQEMRRLLAVGNFDVVICHGTWTHAIFSPVIRAAGAVSVLWQHDAPTVPMGWLDRWASWSAPDRLICNSEYTRAGTARLYPGVPSDCVYCPVSLPDRSDNPDARARLRSQFGAAPDTVVILQVGRWESHKGHLFHIQGLKALTGVVGWECWQVGGPQRPTEDAYLASVRREAVLCGVADRVRFLGYQPDVGALMGVADVYCQPNIRPEPFGITFIEAMLSGLPVVATALGGPKEILDQTCGLLVPPGDVAALAEALRRLIREPELRHRLGHGGPARAAALSDPARQLRRLAQALADACGRAAPVGPRELQKIT